MVKKILEFYKGLSMKGKIIAATSFFLLLGILGGCATFWKSYPQDNAIEELAEDVLKAETGIDIDLSPNTPEIK